MNGQLLGILLIALVVAIVTLMIVFKNKYIVKVSWRYALILFPAVIMFIIMAFNWKKTVKTTASTDHVSDIGEAISNIQNQLIEAHQVSAVEATAIKEDNKVQLDALKQISQIKDSAERRKQLADMMG